jgi:hypothetical protein
MAGDPAITKVSDGLQDLLTQMNMSVFVDRSDEEPILDEERPCVVIRIVDVQFTPIGMAEMRHEVTVDFDFYDQLLSAATITRRHAVMIAKANGLIAADRTVGGMLESLELRSATAEIDAMPDLGCATLTGELSFLTPRGDFTTILGASRQF